MEQLSPNRAERGEGAFFWRGTFTGKMDRSISRGARVPAVLRRATRDEIAFLLGRVRETIAIGDTAMVWRMTKKNPDVLRAICDTPGGQAHGIFAYLPLNAFGAAQIVEGQFDGANPDPAWICRPGETPEALYWWLVYTPRRLSRVLGAIARLFRELAPRGAPVFSRAANAASERLQLSVGFRRAAELHPKAPDWLLVALPEHKPIARPPMPARRELRVELVRTMAGLTEVFALRSATYVAEQFCTYDEEFDGNDLCASHFVAKVDGDPAGAIRLRYFGDFAKLERLCVRREYRGSGVKEALVEAALELARAKRFRQVYGHSRFDLLDMWARFGFHAIEGRPTFRFANIDYVEIIRELEPDETAIRLGVPPMMTIRPEGAWDEPGPLDWSNVAPDPARAALLAQHTRFRA